MPRLHRVLPYLESAAAGAPGHPLHIPASTGANRVDNPDIYDALYLGDSPLCAVAEAFGWAPRWSAGLLRGTPSLPGSVRALISYDLDQDAAVCDLDDADRLSRLGLRPSRVVTPNRSITQAWARELFDTREFAGARWWSYYNPDWGSVGLWDTAALTVIDVSVLSAGHPMFVAAAAEIVRVIE
jgi:hypothetical protein